MPVAAPLPNAFEEFQQANHRFAEILSIQHSVLQRLSSSRGLHPLVTRGSDEHGVVAVASPDGGTHATAQGFAARPRIDWAYHNLAINVPAQFGYGNIGVFLGRGVLTPGFRLEMGTGYGGDPSVLLFIQMEPQLSLLAHWDYFQRYYESPPRPGLSSWAELEASCSSQPGFQRFTSRFLAVRVAAPTAISFMVTPDAESGPSVAREVVNKALDIWMAWEEEETQAQAQAGGRPEEALLAEAAVHSEAYRRFTYRDPNFASVPKLIGDVNASRIQQMLVGDPSIMIAGAS